jgi:hypothetical protein
MLLIARKFEESSLVFTGGGGIFLAAAVTYRYVAAMIEGV